MPARQISDHPCSQILSVSPFLAEHPPRPGRGGCLKGLDVFNTIVYIIQTYALQGTTAKYSYHGFYKDFLALCCIPRNKRPRALPTYSGRDFDLANAFRHGALHETFYSPWEPSGAPPSWDLLGWAGRRRRLRLGWPLDSGRALITSGCSSRRSFGPRGFFGRGLGAASSVAGG